MEDLNKSIKQTSVLDSDIKGKEKEVVKNNKLLKRNKLSSLVYVIFLVSVIISYCIFMFVYFDKTYSPNKDIQPNEDSTIDVEQDETSETEHEDNGDEIDEGWNGILVGTVTDKPDGMKEYYNEIVGVKFSYPSDWEIIEEEAMGEDELILKIGDDANATEDIFLYEMIPTEPVFCVYSESELTVSEEPTYEKYYDNYVTVGTGDLYRRSYIPYGDVNSYFICQKYENGNYYANPYPGFITYWNFDKNDEDADMKLEILDRILLSFEYSGEK